MKTIVITGGTDGIGRALADRYLRRGDQVCIIGTSADKGDAFVTDAAHRGIGERASFLQADLSRIGENIRVIDALTARLERIDVLVLGARFQRSTRSETTDGIESSFALMYLSRFLLSHGLIDLLGRAEDPVALTFGGAFAFGSPNWGDLQQKQNYNGMAAMVHAGVLSDYLAIDVVSRYPAANIRFVDNFPGPVATSFAGDHHGDPRMRAQLAQLRATARSVEAAVDDVLPALDQPGATRLTSVNQGIARPFAPGAVERADARRLFEYTRDLVEPTPHC